MAFTGNAESRTAVACPFFDQQAGHDPVEFLATGYKMVEPVQAMQCCRPTFRRRCEVEELQWRGGSHYPGENKLAPGDILGEPGFALLQRHQPEPEAGYSGSLARPKVESAGQQVPQECEVLKAQRMSAIEHIVPRQKRVDPTIQQEPDFGAAMVNERIISRANCG